MSEQSSEYAPGGYIPGPPNLTGLPPSFGIHPDECVMRPDRPHVCVRPDHAGLHGTPRQETT